MTKICSFKTAKHRKGRSFDSAKCFFSDGILPYGEEKNASMGRKSDLYGVFSSSIFTLMNWILRNIERYRVFGFGLWAVCLKATGEMIGDCGLTMQLINGEIKPEIGYHIRADMQRNGYAKEAAIAVRDWTFDNTPFNIVYSYMKYTNEASVRTAMSYGCKQVDEYKDDVNGIIKVFAITREEWANL